MNSDLLFCVAFGILALAAAAVPTRPLAIGTATAHRSKVSHRHEVPGVAGHIVSFLSSDPHESSHHGSHAEEDDPEGAQHGPGQHDEPGHNGGYNVEASAVAFVLITFAILIPIVSYMALQNGEISHLTLQLLDYFVTLLIAMLYFQVLSDFLRLPMVQNAFPRVIRPYAEEIVAAAHGFVMYVIFLLVVYKNRNNGTRVMILAGCFAHYVAFAGIAAGQMNQHKAGSFAPLEYRPLVSFLVVAAVVVLFGLVSVITQRCVANTKENEQFKNAVDHMELDIAGLVLSYMTMQAIRHTLTGRYPAKAHMLIQSSSPHFVHTGSQRMFMLCFSVVLTVIAALVLTWVARSSERILWDESFVGRWKRKIIQVSRMWLVMCVSWGYLLWGEWEFYEQLFYEHGMFGQVLFASIVTVVALFTLWGLSELSMESRTVHTAKRLTLLGVSLAMAWSWEHCFSFALEVLGDKYEVGYGGLVPKTIIAIVVPLSIAPVYLQFLHPSVEAHEEFMATQQKPEEAIEEPAWSPTDAAAA